MAKNHKLSKEQNIINVHAFRERERDCKYDCPANFKRRSRLEKDTSKWLRYYLYETFPLDFAEIHKKYIFDLDYIIKYGGWKAEVLPRSSGKTTIAQGRALKSILSGESSYVVMIAARADFSRNLIKTFKSWLLYNDRLASDYPEVCIPIRHTKGIAQAMTTLTAFGEPVYLKWTANQIVLPNCDRLTEKGNRIKSKSANAIIDSDGITGAIRGRNYALPNGKMMRPDLCIVDDPQTDASAKSIQQTADRLNIIKADIVGLAGPSKDIRIIVPCTIIKPDDLADQISNPDKNPDFIGERHPFFVSMPENIELWEDYNEVRIKALKRRDRGEAAKKFYLKNKTTLDAGAVVTWPDRKGDNCLNGIHWGMNKYFQLGVKAFQTELQGAPLPAEEMIRITSDHVLACENDLPRWVVPAKHFVTTAFIDCNPRTSGLHWSINSFGQNMEAHICAYSVYPSRGTLVPEGASDAQEDALLFEGLRKVCEAMAKANITTTDSKIAKIDLVMIDGGYKFATVQKFVQSARFPFQLAVSRGRAATRYLDAGRDVLKAMPNIHLRKNAQNERYLSHNSDIIREIVHRAFVAGKDAPGGVSIHKAPPLHENFANQIISVRLTDKAEGQKGMMYKWGKIPGAGDHWLDCETGCFAGACWLGLSSDTKKNIQSRNSSKRGFKIRKMKI